MGSKYKDCEVCLTQIKGHNKEISCIHCNKKCCKSCFKTYILGSNNSAKCMYNECDKPFSREFLIDNLGYTFVNTHYKKHREQLLYDIEISKFEETMGVIESRKELYEAKENLEKINEKIKNFNTKEVKEAKKEIENYRRINYTPSFKSNKNLNHQIKFLEEMLKRKKKLKKALEGTQEENLEILKNQRWEIQRKIYRLENINIKIKKEKFFGHCPEPDCKGLINSKLRCVICEVLVCRSCKVKIAKKETPEEEIKENKKNHTCNENDIKSIEQVKKMCKPCPNCKVPIALLEGCSQMFCIECKTIFSWTTGEIVTSGAFHNPHYLEWRKRTGENPNQNIRDACGERITAYKINTNGKIKELCYFLEDLRHRQLHRLNTIINEDKTLEFRIDYIRKKITEKKFKQKLQIEEKKKEKLKDYYMILDMFDNSCQDYLYAFQNDKNKQKLKKTLEELIDYTNKSFNSLKDIYKNKIPQIKYENGRFTL